MKRQIELFCVSLLFILSSFSSFSQEESKGKYLGKADLYKAKKNAFEFLSDSMVVRNFGIISDSIWNFAELGMQEFRSSALLIKTLEDAGFNVEKNVAGIPTCFIATWGTGSPVIGILGEYDALPMLSQKALTPRKDPVVDGAPGHGCGHNTMGTAGVAAIIAIKRSMELNNIKGTIKFFGSPAEETLVGRPFMARAGVFNGLDAVIDNHASSDFSTAYGVVGSAVMSIVFTFRGKTAHAAGAPWSGRSALDAVELMDVSTNFLREHLFYTSRMHYVITEGGESPNVVPDKASVWYYLRNTDERLEEMFGRVVDCAKGAAIATGTVLDTVNLITATHQRHLNKGLAETIQRNIELVGIPQWTEKENMFARALQKELGAKVTGYPSKIKALEEPPDIQIGGSSSDVGEVTLIAPTATVGFPTGVPGSIGHHWSTVASGYGSAAWKGLNAGARVIAATALDLITKPELLEKIKNEFKIYSEKHPYKSFLPAKAVPPLDLNKNLMDKYKQALMNCSSYE